MDVEFSSKSLPLDQNLAFWRELVRGSFGFDFRFRPEEMSNPDAVLARLGNIGSGYRFDTASRGLEELSRGPFEASSSENLVSFLMLVEGEMEFSHASQRCAMRAGDVVFLDMGRRVKACCSPRSRIMGLAFSRRLLVNRLDAERAHMARIDNSRPPGSLVATYVRMLVEAPPALDEGVGNALIENLLSLAAIAVSPAPDGPVGDRNARVQLPIVRRYILLHLSDPELTPQAVAAHFGISPRYLHKLFEPVGQTFSDFVRARRLDACRNDLLDSAKAERTVAEIAFGWGFSDLSHFGRCFRAAFGVAPRQFRKGTGD